MALNGVMAQAAAQAAKLLPTKELGVVELGNQSWRGRDAVPGMNGVTTAKEFYSRLGFGRYQALDVNTKMDAIVFDLNRADASAIANAGAPFSLVTNNGTGEHVFNQASVFYAVHELCDPNGGRMIHCLPFWRWPNHGFFNYNPILFRDLAAANHYEIEFAWLGLSGGKYIEADRSLIFKEREHKNLAAFIDKRFGSRPILFTVCMKRTNGDGFRFPLQGKYKGSVEDESLQQRYSK